MAAPDTAWAHSGQLGTNSLSALRLYSPNAATRGCPAGSAKRARPRRTEGSHAQPFRLSHKLPAWLPTPSLAPSNWATPLASRNLRVAPHCFPAPLPLYV